MKPRLWRSWVSLVVLTGTLALTPAGAQAPPVSPGISRANAIADLNALFEAIERIHPDPYFLRSRELVAVDRQKLIDSLPDTMTRNDWWMRLAPVVAGLGDGHTELPPPTGFAEQFVAAYRSDKTLSPRQILERIHQFPSGSLAVDENGHLLVTSQLGEGARRGDRVIAINGHNADGLLAEWLEQTSGDSDANRRASTLLRATDLLATRSIVSPYRLTVAGSDGVERTASVDGPTMQSVIDARAATANFSYRALQPGIGYMDFYSMGGDYGRFKKALAAMFRRVSADKVRTLIVDLRNNMGGYEQFGEELLRYVTRNPYRTWTRMEVKRSDELRSQGSIAAPFRWAPFKYLVPDARRIYAGPAGTFGVWKQDSLKTPSRANPFFSGPLCVLTGARTFSAGVILADAVKTYQLAMIVGEETGGRANMTIEPVLYGLPNSKLAVSIAAGRSIRANGDARDHHGVIPDIVVKTTALDIQNGRDPVLDRARDCPLRQ